MRGSLQRQRALLHESLNGTERVHLSEAGVLFDGYRYRLTELAKAIEDGATQLGFSLLTIGTFCAQTSSDDHFIPRKYILDMGLTVVAGCPPPLEDPHILNVGDVLVSLRRVHSGQSVMAPHSFAGAPQYRWIRHPGGLPGHRRRWHCRTSHRQRTAQPDSPHPPEVPQRRWDPGYAHR